MSLNSKSVLKHITEKSAQYNRRRASEKKLLGWKGVRCKICVACLLGAHLQSSHICFTGSLQGYLAFQGRCSHTSLQPEGFIINNSLFIFHSFKRNICLQGGRALLALGAVTQLQDGAAWAPRACVGLVRLKSQRLPGLYGHAWGSAIPVLHDSTKASPDNATDLTIPGNLQPALIFSIPPYHISSQNTCFTGFVPVVKNNILFLCKIRIIFLTFFATHCFHLNTLRVQVAMVSACLLSSFPSYKWEAAFVC